MIDGVVDGLCGEGLLLAELVEGNKEFVIHSTRVVEQAPSNRLDASDTVLVKIGTVVSTGCVLYLGAGACKGVVGVWRGRDD